MFLLQSNGFPFSQEAMCEGHTVGRKFDFSSIEELMGGLSNFCFCFRGVVLFIVGHRRG